MKINLFSKRKLIEKAKEGQNQTQHEAHLKAQLEQEGLRVETQKIYPSMDNTAKYPYKTADLLVRCGKEKLAVHVDGSHHGTDKQKIKDKEAETLIGYYGHDQMRVSNDDVKSGNALRRILAWFTFFLKR